MKNSKSPLLEAIDADAYVWLEQQAPVYLTAIEQELAAGRTPDQIRRLVGEAVGPERSAFALRCYQAAKHVQRMQECPMLFELIALCIVAVLAIWRSGGLGR